jgi:hypothetical protein
VVAEAVALVSIRSLEEVKRMVEAAQAVLTAQVVQARSARREADGRSVRGVPAEVRRDVALFRGVNTPTAKALVEVSVDAPVQAPQLFEQWVEGQVGEEKLVSFFKSTDLLTGEGRRDADGEVADVAGQVGVRDFRERVNRVVARLEPEQAAERVRKAHERRHVSLRPTGEGMATLTGLLPGVAGQGVEAILSAYAKSRKAAGDERTEGQVKADALTGIVIGWAQATGRAPKGFTSTYRIRPGGATKPTAAENAADPAIGADAVDEMDDALPGLGEVDAAREAFARFLTDPAGTSGSGPGGDGLGADGTRPDGIGGSVLPPGVGVCVNLVITDVSLFGFTDTPAELFGLGPVPAPIAREMVKDAHARDVATLRRLYTDPASGALVGMESKSRIFPDGLAQMIGARDQFCRFPFCDTRIKHLDHIHPHSQGGATSFGNAQGLCAHHNLIKEADAATTYPVTVAGDIITRLACGQEFVSPARWVPHETAESMRFLSDQVAVSDFWDRPVPVDPQPELAEFYTDEYMNRLCDEYENEAA